MVDYETMIILLNRIRKVLELKRSIAVHIVTIYSFCFFIYALRILNSHKLLEFNWFENWTTFVFRMYYIPLSRYPIFIKSHSFHSHDRLEFIINFYQIVFVQKKMIEIVTSLSFDHIPFSKLMEMSYRDEEIFLKSFLIRKIKTGVYCRKISVYFKWELEICIFIRSDEKNLSIIQRQFNNQRKL